MSRSLLTRLLEEIYNHSFFVWKVSFTILIISRIVLTAVGGQYVYYDEQSEFTCNTQYTGCKNSCYDTSTPLSHVRFWVFQIIVILVPPVMYLGYIIHRISRGSEEDRRKDALKEKSFSRSRTGENTGDDEEEDKESKKLDGQKNMKEEGLMKIYYFQLVSRTILEVAFLVGQCYLYGLQVPNDYPCRTDPCSHTVSCFISRSTEKTIFLRIMFGVSCLSLVLDICEMFHLIISIIRDAICRRRTNTARKPLCGDEGSAKHLPKHRPPSGQQANVPDQQLNILGDSSGAELGQYFT